MESKSIIFGAIGLVIGGGGLIVVHSFSLESIKSDVKRKQADVAAIRQSLKTAQEVLDRNNERIAELKTSGFSLQEQKQVVEDLDRDVAKYTKLVASGKEQWTANVQELQQAIDQVRFAFRNQIVPEIAQKTGEPLKDCRFSSYRDGGVTVQHNTGSARLTADQLPAELADRLRLNFGPTLQLPPDPDDKSNLLQTTNASGSGSTAAAQPAADPSLTPVQTETGAALPGVATQPTGNANADGIAAKQQTINTLQAKIATATAQMSTYLAQAKEANEKYKDARLRGRISTQDSIRDKAQAAADQLQNQINQAQIQISTLQSEITALRN